MLIDVAPPAQGKPAGAAPEARVAVTEGEVRGFLPQAGAGPDAAGVVIRSADGSETRLAAAPGDAPAAFRVTKGKKGTEVAMTAGEARMDAAAPRRP